MHNLLHADRQRVPVHVQRTKVKRFVEQQHRIIKRRACLGSKPARHIKQAY